MARRYSRVSNYIVGQTVRMLVFGAVGFIAALVLLPRAPFIHTQQELAIGCLVVAFLAAMMGKRYT